MRSITKSIFSLKISMILPLQNFIRTRVLHYFLCMQKWCRNSIGSTRSREVYTIIREVCFSFTFCLCSYLTLFLEPNLQPSLPASKNTHKQTQVSRNRSSTATQASSLGCQHSLVKLLHVFSFEIQSRLKTIWNGNMRESRMVTIILINI